MSAPGTRISDDIDDIVVGDTGYCFILGLTGTTVAHKNRDLVLNQDNFQETAKKDASFVSIANFAKEAMEAKTPSVGFYTFNGQKTIGSYATMQTTGWKVIIRAPINEFMGAVSVLGYSMIVLGIILLVVALVFIFFIAQAMVNPVRTVANALKNIAQGEGDLTVRLPLIGNDEVTELSQYFNQTIAKIGSSIKAVETNSRTMKRYRQ